MMELKIKPLMDAKGMSMKDMERASGVSYNTVRTWYYNEVKSLNFQNLESICKALDCTPNDILISDEISYLQYYNENNEPVSISIDISGDTTKEDIIYAVQQLQSEFSDVVNSTQKQIDELMKLIPQTAKDTNTDT